MARSALQLCVECLTVYVFRRGRVFIQLMTSNRKLTVSREV